MEAAGAAAGAKAEAEAAKAQAAACRAEAKTAADGAEGLRDSAGVMLVMLGVIAAELQAAELQAAGAAAQAAGLQAAEFWWRGVITSGRQAGGTGGSRLQHCCSRLQSYRAACASRRPKWQCGRSVCSR